MATDITLAPFATRTTTTKVDPRQALGQAYVQPYEVDTIAAGDVVDLDDDRACSVELFALREEPAPRPPLEVWIETREDLTDGDWREVARFSRFEHNKGTMRERVGFVADRYVRACWRIARDYSSAKGAVRFSVLGRATGGA